jgi:hypothetical protein
MSSPGDPVISGFDNRISGFERFSGSSAANVQQMGSEKIPICVDRAVGM